jgi:hypothetical protein
MSTNVGFYVKCSVESMNLWKLSFTSFNSSWFPITMESMCFDVQHLKLCAHLCWFGWWASILCYSTWGWITLTRFLPLLLSFGEKSGWIRYLHLYCILLAWIIWCSDIFILFKCMWQICNVLQFMIELHVQIFQVREYKDWMSMTFLIYLSAFFVVLISP